jgi:uncharacterized OB-fold protein
VNSWVVYTEEADYPAVFSDDIPYVVAEVELREGPRYISKMVDCAVDEVYRGMSVECCFKSVTDDFVLPFFKPASDTDTS